MIPQVIINETSLPDDSLSTSSIDRGSGVVVITDDNCESDAIKTVSLISKINSSRRYSLSSLMDELGGNTGDSIEISIKRLVSLEES